MFVHLVALALMAPAPAEAVATSAASSTNPNEKICESIPVIGSRLAKKRVCATRAEWDETRRLDREAVEQAQKLIGGPCQTTPSARNGGPTSC
jgi:hypothetical protein